VPDKRLSETIEYSRFWRDSYNWDHYFQRLERLVAENSGHDRHTKPPAAPHAVAPMEDLTAIAVHQTKCRSYGTPIGVEALAMIPTTTRIVDSARRQPRLLRWWH